MARVFVRWPGEKRQRVVGDPRYAAGVSYDAQGFPTVSGLGGTVDVVTSAFGPSVLDAPLGFLASAYAMAKRAAFPPAQEQPVSLLDGIAAIANVAGQISANKTARKLAQYQTRALLGRRNAAGVPMVTPPVYQVPGPQTPYGQPLYPAQPTQAPYVDPGVTQASYGGGGVQFTNANLLALPEIAGGVATGARALAATPFVRGLVSWLGAHGLDLATAGTLAYSLVHDLGVKGGPYANAADNRTVGVMRGDLKAVKRLRRNSKILRKALSLAGGGRRGAGRFRRRRAC